ncbi:unnamed protein product [Mytilus coruscus]|uniref:TRIM2_3 n=1 Tax=Mytilus coruscus TaxID=42192 RepID=A0A6J8AVH8_MYTCO|nr:unnamed protein product [Mytilus coruscus]
MNILNETKHRPPQSAETCFLTEIEPNKEEFAPDKASVKTNPPVSVTLRQQFNIIKSENENPIILSCIKIGNTLVFTDCDNYRLIICNSDGTDIHHIPLSYEPYHMTVVNSKTVAVSCTGRTILIINISTGSVTSTINTSGDCSGISYNDNNLYVVIDIDIIHVMDLTGKVIRTIPLPSDGIDDITVDRDRLVCIDYTSSIYCCSLDGKLIWKFKQDKFQDLHRVTTDNEGNVYVTDYNTNTVVVISDDGQHHRELLTKSDGLNEPWGIYFDKKENILLAPGQEEERRGGEKKGTGSKGGQTRADSEVARPVLGNIPSDGGQGDEKPVWGRYDSDAGEERGRNQGLGVQQDGPGNAADTSEKVAPAQD